MSTATQTQNVWRAKRNVSGIAAQFNVQDLYIIFLDNQTSRWKLMHFQEAEKSWFKVSGSREERTATIEEIIMPVPDKESKVVPAAWNDQVEVWTPTHTYTCSRAGIISTETAK